MIFLFSKTQKGKNCNCFLVQVEWVVSRDGESYFIFSGGLPQDVTGAQPSITVMQVYSLYCTLYWTHVIKNLTINTIRVLYELLQNVIQYIRTTQTPKSTVAMLKYVGPMFIFLMTDRVNKTLSDREVPGAFLVGKMTLI